MSAGGLVPPPPVAAELELVEVDELLSDPHAAINALSAAEPPVRAMNLRLDTGSLAARAIALSDISLS